MPERPPDPVRIALLGCGNVGAALVELLAEPRSAARVARRSGVSFELVGIAVGDPTKPRSEEPWFPTDRILGDAASLVARDDVDLVVELIGGIEPAGQLTEQALRAGKPVVSANKALLAERGAYLSSLADSLGVDLNFEAAVAGAIPVIRTLRESLAGEEITRVMGIVNGTTNYILSKMAGEGRGYDDVLGEAQTLGLATIAEGVEFADQADRLAQIGCTLAQGYNLGRPIDAMGTESLLRAQTQIQSWTRTS